jgi:hypothetical protein
VYQSHCYPAKQLHAFLPQTLRQYYPHINYLIIKEKYFRRRSGRANSNRSGASPALSQQKKVLPSRHVRTKALPTALRRSRKLVIESSSRPHQRVLYID